jgi:GT2 family glycosyltransferase
MLKDEFPFVKIIANKENIGATRAKNQTFKIASGRYVLILDSDIELVQDAISAMFDFMEKNPSVGILGPRVKFPNGYYQHSCNGYPPNIAGSFLDKFLFLANLRYTFYRTRIGSRYLKIMYNRDKEFIWLGGMCLLARREVIQQLGGMDEGFFIYFDDTDFCIRARKAGWKVYYTPSAIAIHHMSRGVKKFSNFIFPKIFKSELYFFNKHYGRFQKVLVAIFIALAMSLRILPAMLLFILGVKKDYLRGKIKAYWSVLIFALKEIYGKTN